MPTARKRVTEDPIMKDKLSALEEVINLSSPLTFGHAGDWKSYNQSVEQTAAKESSFAKSLPRKFLLTDPERPYDHNLKHLPKALLASRLATKPSTTTAETTTTTETDPREAASTNHAEASSNSANKAHEPTSSSSSSSFSSTTKTKPNKLIPLANRAHMDGILHGIPHDNSPIKSNGMENYVYTNEMQLMNDEKDRRFFRKRDSYSEYVEARARFSKMHSVT